MTALHATDLTDPADPAPVEVPTHLDGPLTGVATLRTEALAGRFGPDPATLVATSAFAVHHGTRLAGGDRTFRTRYLLLRSGRAFGACAVEALPLDEDQVAALAGRSLAELLHHDLEPVRLAALDAYLGAVQRWGVGGAAGGAGVTVELPAGSPEERAAARDAVVAELLGTEPGRRIGIVGVVNPLVAAVRDRGCEPLPCDLWLERTAWGDEVSRSYADVVPRADAVVATGMTLGNGTFDGLASLCRRHGVPLALYAQTGSAVARALVGRSIAAASCEPFPFSQFSAEATSVHLHTAPAAPAAPVDQAAR